MNQLLCYGSVNKQPIKGPSTLSYVKENLEICLNKHNKNLWMWRVWKLEFHDNCTWNLIWRFGNVLALVTHRSHMLPMWWIATSLCHRFIPHWIPSLLFKLKLNLLVPKFDLNLAMYTTFWALWSIFFRLEFSPHLYSGVSHLHWVPSSTKSMRGVFFFLMFYLKSNVGFLVWGDVVFRNLGVRFWVLREKNLCGFI